MKFPRRSPYLIFRRIARDEYRVKNFLYSETYRTNHMTATFLLQLNGKRNPYDLLPECRGDYVRQLIKDLEKCNMLAPPKKEPMSIGKGCWIFPLIYCYPRKAHRRLAQIWNCILLLMFVPLLMQGIFIRNGMMHLLHMQSKGEIYAGLLIGIGVGVLLHELSHTCATLAYGGRLFEIGVGIRLMMPLGYVLLDDSHIKSKFHRVQINAAGIEMNLLLYGVFICLIPTGFVSSFTMYLAAVANLGLALVNLLPLDLFDGIRILSVIFGKKDLLEHAKILIKRKKHYRKNPGRAVAVTASYALVGFQIVFPLMMVYEVFCLVKLILL